MRLCPHHPQFDLTLTGTRSVAWKLALGVLPPEHSVQQWCEHLREQRQSYERVRHTHTREIMAVAMGWESEA